MSKFFIGKILVLSFLLNGCSSSYLQQDSNNSGEKPYSKINEDENTDRIQIYQNELPSDSRNLTQLPFQDFKERWNAITDEQRSNMYIRNFEKVEHDEKTIYHAALDDQIELRVYVDKNFIYQLEIISEGTSTTSVFTMLTGWNQMINILHPTIQGNDVDALFHQMGVGPNGDLSKLITEPIYFTGINYQVLKTETGYSFRASYDTSQ